MQTKIVDLNDHLQKGDKGGKIMPITLWEHLLILGTQRTQGFETVLEACFGPSPY